MVAHGSSSTAFEALWRRAELEAGDVEDERLTGHRANAGPSERRWHAPSQGPAFDPSSATLNMKAATCSAAHAPPAGLSSWKNTWAGGEIPWLQADHSICTNFEREESLLDACQRPSIVEFHSTTAR